MRGRVCAFYLFEQRRFAGIVETEEKDRILCRLLDGQVSAQRLGGCLGPEMLRLPIDVTCLLYLSHGDIST